MTKIMKPEPTVRVPDEVLGRFPSGGELLRPVMAFAVVPVRHDLVLADFDDLAE
jgi:hypothetical protein